RQLEGIPHDPLGAVTGEDRLLHDHFARRALEHHATDVGILALGVLAHDQEIDIAGGAAGKRTGHAVEGAHGPQIDVLVELTPELEDGAPERDVIGYRSRPAHRAEIDRVHAGEALFPV